MKIYFNGWFGGFFDKTNPGLNKDFFLNLFEKVYNEKCYVGTLEESEIFEVSTFHKDSDSYRIEKGD